MNPYTVQIVNKHIHFAKLLSCKLVKKKNTCQCIFPSQSYSLQRIISTFEIYIKSGRSRPLRIFQVAPERLFSFIKRDFYQSIFSQLFFFFHLGYTQTDSQTSFSSETSNNQPIKLKSSVENASIHICRLGDKHFK